jgi:hypothetical protein
MLRKAMRDVEREDAERIPFKPFEELLPGLDADALETLCRHVATLEIDDKAVAWIEPIGSCDDNMIFDGAICAAGLKVFARRTMPSDGPAEILDCVGKMLIVIEARPGLRLKHGLSGFVPIVGLPVPPGDSQP